MFSSLVLNILQPSSCIYTTRFCLSGTIQIYTIHLMTYSYTIKTHPPYKLFITCMCKVVTIWDNLKYLNYMSHFHFFKIHFFYVWLLACYENVITHFTTHMCFISFNYLILFLLYFFKIFESASTNKPIYNLHTLILRLLKNLVSINIITSQNNRISSHCFKNCGCIHRYP